MTNHIVSIISFELCSPQRPKRVPADSLRDSRSLSYSPPARQRRPAHSPPSRRSVLNTSTYYSNFQPTALANIDLNLGFPPGLQAGSREANLQTVDGGNK